MRTRKVAGGTAASTAAVAALAVLLLAPGLSPQRLAAEPDPLAGQRALFVKLRPAAEAGNWSAVEPRLDELADYPLLPDLRAAWLQRRLGRRTDAETAEFLARYPDLGFSDELRLRWARSLARRGRWSTYLEVYETHLTALENTALDCLALQARQAAGPDEAWAEDALAYWLSPFSQPRECDPVFERLAAGGAITPVLRRERIDLALDSGQIRLARFLARASSEDERTRIERWARMRRNPDAELSRPDRFEASADDRRLVAYGLERLAGRDPLRAAALLPRYDRLSLTPEARAGIRRTAALTAARRFLPEARELLDAAPAAADDRLVAQWRIRIALRSLDWKAAEAALDALPEDEARRAGWRYWRARVLKETGRGTAAGAAFEQLAGERGYYGFLAADRIEAEYRMGHAPANPDEAVLAALSSRADVLRARELFLTGLYGRGRSEWVAALAAMSDEEKAQASILAHRWGWYSRAIRTASRHGLEDDLELRYPLPWRDSFQQQSQRASIEPTWAYGVARSESLFMPDVASSAGAVGLMQLMPDTGRSTARKRGIRYRGRHSLTDPDQNIALGTSYLADMLARFDNHRVLATAAYNAGPHRVERWLPDDDSLPADVWVESVPFRETRRYLRRVLAAEAVFAWRIDGQAVRLSERMPPVPARGS